MFKNLTLIPALVAQIKLVIHLFLDPQITIGEKILPGAILGLGLFYIISPIDFIFDFLPFIGIADDFGVFIAMLNLIPKFFKPEHTTRLKKEITGQK